ncbi:cationic amino acid transporter, partial [Staphylococcus nepalensis]
GKAIGVIAIILSLSFIIIYLPGMPSSLIWPSEWLIVFVWYGIAAILYYVQKRKNKVVENDKSRSFEPSNE